MGLNESQSLGLRFALREGGSSVNGYLRQVYSSYLRIASAGRGLWGEGLPALLRISEGQAGETEQWPGDTGGDEARPVCEVTEVLFESFRTRASYLLVHCSSLSCDFISCLTFSDLWLWQMKVVNLGMGLKPDICIWQLIMNWKKKNLLLKWVWKT